MFINNLPKWTIPDLHPAFFDTESATAIEMVAKLYGKVKEVVDHYNEFTTDMNDRINDAFDYLKTNLHKTCMDVINQLIKSGEFYVGVNYDEETESLNIIYTGGDIDE